MLLRPSRLQRAGTEMGEVEVEIQVELDGAEIAHAREAGNGEQRVNRAKIRAKRRGPVAFLPRAATPPSIWNRCEPEQEGRFDISPRKKPAEPTSRTQIALLRTPHMENRASCAQEGMLRPAHGKDLENRGLRIAP